MDILHRKPVAAGCRFTNDKTRWLNGFQFFVRCWNHTVASLSFTNPEFPVMSGNIFQYLFQGRFFHSQQIGTLHHCLLVEPWNGDQSRSGFPPFVSFLFSARTSRWQSVPLLEFHSSYIAKKGRGWVFTNVNRGIYTRVFTFLRKLLSLRGDCTSFLLNLFLTLFVRKNISFFTYSAKERQFILM